MLGCPGGLHLIGRLTGEHAPLPPFDSSQTEPQSRPSSSSSPSQTLTLQLLHQISTSVTPFSYPGYAEDVYELERVHPVAMYRRLAEPAAQRSKNGRELRVWTECMDRWAEELGVREKMRVSLVTITGNVAKHGLDRIGGGERNAESTSSRC